MTRRVELPKKWAKLAGAAGGVGKLARLVGVHYVTIERWAEGGKARRSACARVREVARSLGVASPL